MMLEIEFFLRGNLKFKEIILDTGLPNKYTSVVQYAVRVGERGVKKNINLVGGNQVLFIFFK